MLPVIPEKVCLSKDTSIKDASKEYSPNTVTVPVFSSDPLSLKAEQTKVPPLVESRISTTSVIAVDPKNATLISSLLSGLVSD